MNPSTKPTSPTANTPSSKPSSLTGSMDLGPHALGEVRRPLRLGPVRPDRPQPAPSRRQPGRRAPLGGRRNHTAPQNRQRRRPIFPPTAPTSAASTQPLALGHRMAHIVAQHHRLASTTVNSRRLTTRRKARPENQGSWADQRIRHDYTPKPRSGQSTPAHRRLIGGSRLIRCSSGKTPLLRPQFGMGDGAHVHLVGAIEDAHGAVPAVESR